MSREIDESLYYAVREGDLHKVQNILQKDPDIIKRWNQNSRHTNITPCHLAALQGHVDILQLLVNHGVNVNMVNKYGDTPLHVVAGSSNGVKCIELLLKFGADIKARNNRGETPCQSAIMLERKECAEYLLKNAGNEEDTVNSVNNDGNTSLHEAAVRGDVDIVQLVLNHGANVNMVNSEGDTPLHMAACEESVKLLLKSGANIKARNGNGETPYQRAISLNHDESVKCLRNAGNEKDTVNSVDNDGNTALHKAALRNVDMLKLVLKHGANVNVVNSEGDTPLHVAARKGHVSRIKLLLKSGANIKARNNNGKTPYQTAIEGEREKAAEFLRNAANGEDEELINPSEEEEEKEYRRAYSEALEEGEAKNNRIPIMLIGQDRAGKTSLMTRLQGLPFNKDQPSTNGIDVNVIELTKQNAKNPWVKREVKEFMTSEGEAETMKYQIAAKYFDRQVPRNSGEDAPEPLKSVMPGTPVMSGTPVMPVIAEKPVMPVNPMNPLPVEPLSREKISKIKSLRGIQPDQKNVLRVFLTDFAGQKIYYDTHGCFVKPHSPYVLVHDLSLEFNEPAVPRFRASEEEEEESLSNPYGTTNLDYFSSWLKLLQGLGECQDQHLSNKSAHCSSVKGENFKLPPVLIALTHCDKVKNNASKMNSVRRRIKKVLSAGRYENVDPEFFVIDNTLEGENGDDVRKLRAKLFDLSNAVLDQEKPMPMKWLNFEVALSKKLSPDCTYISVDEAKTEAEACCIQEFEQAIKFLHRLGAVVYHSGSSKVVLDPHWLMNRFTKVISMPGKLDALSRHALEVFKEKGILFQEYLKTLKDAELLEELMQKFNLISPCQYEEKAAFYVPSVVPSMVSGEELEGRSIPSLFVTFPRQLVPMSLFTKLQVRIITEWKERFPNQQATPSFYCNYSLIPFILDGDVYRVRLIDLHEFVKVTIFPLENGDDSTFVSRFLPILKKCLNDLKSPDQLLFSMTSYDLEVKCTCCFGKEKKKCSRHHKIQCDSDRCGHRHFWKLSELQKLYDDGSPAVCQPLCVKFDIESVQIWLSGYSERDAATEDSQLSNESQGSTSSSVLDVPMVEGSSHSRLSDENVEKASCSGPNSSKRKRSKSDTTCSQERKKKRKKPSSPVEICETCKSNNETPLPRDRDTWSILKIEHGCFEKICKLLDLSDRSKVSLTSALGCFDQDTADHIEKKYEGKGGVGIAKEVLGLWGSSNEKNNVRALRKILKNIMQRRDVVKKIKKWKKMSVCHGCGIRLN